ncbi:MAG TPA: N-acetylmuramoyl-L-alanine amidase [Rhizomicrobium sp.]|jgi:N-acetylmuramoyl-L-alanine amidase|nr:N-acetylmuramoyl-L-alanine amidase [Rhizomicrobium sp.]
MPLRFVECPSPNRDERGGSPIDILVLHYTGMKTAEEALARLTDPAAKVSAHYTVDRDGRVYAHVPEEMRAWHAGVSYWAGERNVNAHSIGIEIVNPGHEFGYVPFAAPQIDAVIELCQGIVSRHPITPSRVVAHSDVAPARKEDPGELFPWAQFAENGIGLWGKFCARLAEVQALARYGYGLPPDADVPMEKVVTAFQRHFRPSKLDGVWDSECGALLAGLLDAT